MLMFAKLIRRSTKTEMEEARKWALQLAEEIDDKVAELNLLDGVDIAISCDLESHANTVAMPPLY